MRNVLGRRARSALLVFIGSTVVGLFFASQAYFNPAVRGLITWPKALAINLAYYYSYGLATPLIIWLGTRFPLLEAAHRLRAVLVHIVASLVVTEVSLIVTEAFLAFVLHVRTDPFPFIVKYSFSANFHSLLPTYWVILLGHHLFLYYAKYRDRELQASQLEARLSEARLAALKMQLRPHFLFNTLNSISSLIYSDRDSADAMLTRLAEFLRMTIDSEAEQLVPLARELEFVRRYLEIEQIRLEDRLRVEYAIESSANEALVPNLVLQPLVENAIHHGVASREEGGTIVITAAVIGEKLRLSVADDGAGLAGGPDRVRVGLGNTHARLRDLYGDAYDLKLAEREGGGVIVEVTVPRR
jgi:two-component system, LytTR family, sensor kinase